MSMEDSPLRSQVSFAQFLRCIALVGSSLVVVVSVLRSISYSDRYCGVQTVVSAVAFNYDAQMTNNR